MLDKITKNDIKVIGLFSLALLSILKFNKIELNYHNLSLKLG